MKEKIARLMYGRYGGDQLGTGLVLLSLILVFMNIFVDQGWLVLVAYLFLGYEIYRMFSRQYEKRRQENYRYLHLIAPFKRYKNLWQHRFQDKTHKYNLCPSCHQMVRVPKGHGKVIVTCPKCKKSFEKRT